MNTLIINGLSSTPFVLLNFNRNTLFDENRQMNSVAYFDIENAPNVSSNLQNIGKTGITHIQINHDGTPIYVLTNLTANITSITETLYDDKIQINASITFN